jgi:lipoate-protein ligase A
MRQHSSNNKMPRWAKRSRDRGRSTGAQAWQAGSIVNPWTLSSSVGDAGPFHHRPDPVEVTPSIWAHRIERTALVLGSSQPDDHVDRNRAEADGVEVCRRRSGGGLVHLVPGDHHWVDLIIPRSSRLWDDDVGRAFRWVGTAWAAALSRVLPPGRRISVHDGPLQRRSAGRRLCFAGLGPGEVTVDGFKVVGLSQRRWRTGARFQCAALWRWRPELLVPYLGPHTLIPDEPGEAGLDPRALPIGLPPDGLSGTPPTPEAVTETLISELPDP